ncbi:MAG: serine hydrolase domain-containing protein [Pseudomonadota bacterium]
MAASEAGQLRLTQDRLSELASEHTVPGAVVVRVTDGTIKTVFNVGVESTVTNRPVSEQTRFQVGSLSKPVAAWVFAALADDGQLSWTNDLRGQFPTGRLPGALVSAQPFSLLQVMSHSAGLSLGGYPGFPVDVPLPDYADHLAGDNNGAGVVQQLTEPGAQFSYSGGGYTLVEYLATLKTGEDFNALAQERVFRPLGMSSASFDGTRPRGPWSDAAAHDAHGNPIAAHRFRANAAAGLTLTASDYARFLIANLSLNDVNRSFLDQLHQPSAPEAFMAHGFFRYADGALLGHNGSNFGWKAAFRFDPKTQAGIVSLTNAESGGRFNQAVLCTWIRDQGNELGARACADARVEAQSQHSQRLVATRIATGVTLVALALTGFLRWRRWRVVSFDNAPLRCVLAGIVLAIGALAAVLLETSVGVQVMTGFRSVPMRTLEFLPPEVIGLYRAIVAALVSFALAGLHRPVTAVQPES